MKTVRVGVVGVGGMGGGHARRFLDGQVRGAVLAAVCDIAPAAMEPFGDVPRFARARDMIASGKVDAVIVATPHYAHTTIGAAALAAGLHVLVEKPISVHKADAEKLIAAHRGRRQVFAAMFNQRTDPHYGKLRELIQTGEFGAIHRVNWIITNWFRTEAYYASGGWRATWEGEGGGVLLNQSPHQLDLWQWLFGMPRTVRAFCAFGKRHAIEVEDEVTAYMEYENGATGVFITSTCEAPGTNRLEVCGDRGKAVVEKDCIRFERAEVPVSEYCRSSPELFGSPSLWHVDIPISGHGGQHGEILQNFVDAILHRTPLLAPAREGIHSVELANAMLLSSIKGRPVALPLDGRVFARVLRKLIRESRIGTRR